MSDLVRGKKRKGKAQELGKIVSISSDRQISHKAEIWVHWGLPLCKASCGTKPLSAQCHSDPLASFTSSMVSSRGELLTRS